MDAVFPNLDEAAIDIWDGAHAYAIQGPFDAVVLPGGLGGAKANAAVCRQIPVRIHVQFAVEFYGTAV